MKELIGKIIYELDDYSNNIIEHKIIGIVGTRFKLERISDCARSNPSILTNLNRFYFTEINLLNEKISERKNLAKRE